MIPARFRVPWISYWRHIVRLLTPSRAQHGRRAPGGNKPPIRGWRCSDHDPPLPPPPRSANVVPVQQTLHNFGRIRKLSPICCTTLLGSKNQEIRHPAPGFFISGVVGRSNEQNTGNKKSSPWVSYSMFFYSVLALFPKHPKRCKA